MLQLNCFGAESDQPRLVQKWSAVDMQQEDEAWAEVIFTLQGREPAYWWGDEGHKGIKGKVVPSMKTYVRAHIRAGGQKLLSWLFNANLTTKL
jgi:hypothetical protein